MQLDWYRQPDRPDGTQKGVVISSKLVIRYTQRPLIGFPLESKASRVKCSDRHDGTSVPFGEILQTALRRVQNQLAAGKQTVYLLHENRILVVHDSPSAEKEKNIHGWKL